jgi:YEATS domain-containing protein 4
MVEEFFFWGNVPKNFRTFHSMRLKGTTVSKKIVFGSVAFALGKKGEEGKSHKWCCYIRGYENEDISYYIKKVVFNLHPSFPNPKRGT